jgi:hypothetical protein
MLQGYAVVSAVHLVIKQGFAFGANKALLLAVPALR